MKIAFLGNMNNLPYYIAKGLQQKGYSITFMVDAGKAFLLDRPESWDKELQNGYPGWITEQPLSEKLRTFKFAFPGLCFKKRIQLLNSFDAVVLNGHWIALGSFLKKDILVANIFAGFDLDVLPDFNQVGYFHRSLKNSGGIINRLMPFFLADIFFKRLIRFQRKGIQRATAVNYFPTGINPASDELLNSIKAGQKFSRLQLRGFDCNKFAYKAPLHKTAFVILNITRFFYLNNRNSNKRNDIMIKGIGSFIKNNAIQAGDIEIIFFNKGEDLAAAKALCHQHGLTPFIKWNPQVTVEELNGYFEYCDVAFDQLGEQWIGAGLFSMLTGRPLIANGRPEIFEKITGEVSPVCQAKTADEVDQWLTQLYHNRPLVTSIGKASREYVLRHYNLDNTINYFADFFQQKNNSAIA
jgi:glycosyltransferase involved in cell wall biosynthesis